MKLSRALSDLVKYTKSVATHDIEMEGEWLRDLGTGGGLPVPNPCYAAGRRARSRTRSLTTSHRCHSGVQLAGVVLQ